MKISIRNLVLAALFLALGILLPIVLHAFPQISKSLSPMHIPVLLCGFVCPWPLALIVGILTPLLSSLFTGMPPIGMPFMIAMLPELGCYGLLAALLYKCLPKTLPCVYISLAGAMLSGRLVYGLSMWLLMLAGRGEYSMQAFLSGAFVNAVPAIVLHIAVIPAIVLALRRAKLLKDA